ncbi:MAD2L1-binding protein-like [Ptychodera flava]|uniref:MAD2L1-binding protein-like n=1 Tax=Ptychodera flava TaxID=63121 RepID=UPI003969DB34
MEAPRGIRKRKIASVETCDVRLDGHVPSHLQSRLVMETIKYLLYQREQIPMPLEHLKRRYVTQEMESRCKKRPSLEDRKCLQTLETVEELFSQIDNVFQMTHVNRIMVLFGSTVVSPKEVYVLDLSYLNSDVIMEDASCKSGVRTLMRALITNRVLSEVDSLPKTNTMVLLETHRDSHQDWFKPKTSFRMPIRGKRFEIRYSSKDTQVPVETINKENYIWYQAPRPIKGFTLKTQDAPSDIFI